LVEALTKLKDLRRPVHAVLLGPQEDVYAAEADRCRAFAERLGIADRVHFLGRVPDGTLRSWYLAADMLVLPSVHEGLGIPVVEGMAAGLPVIATRAAALPETVADAGLTFTPNDADDL